MKRLLIVIFFLATLEVAFRINGVDSHTWWGILLQWCCAWFFLRWPVKFENGKLFTAVSALCIMGAVAFATTLKPSGFWAAVGMTGILTGISFMFNASLPDGKKQLKNDSFFAIYLGVLLGGIVGFLPFGVEALWFGAIFGFAFVVSFMFPLEGEETRQRNYASLDQFVVDMQALFSDLLKLFSNQKREGNFKTPEQIEKEEKEWNKR